MRALLLLLPSLLCAADASPQTTVGDLKNLAACAHRLLSADANKLLTTAEMAAVVEALAHAEADIAAAGMPAPVSHSATAAAVKP